MNKKECKNLFKTLLKIHKQNKKKDKTPYLYSWIYNKKTNEFVLYFEKEMDKDEIIRILDSHYFAREICNGT